MRWRAAFNAGAQFATNAGEIAMLTASYAKITWWNARIAQSDAWLQTINALAEAGA